RDALAGVADLELDALFLCGFRHALVTAPLQGLSLGHGLNGLDDVDVPGAAADVALDRTADLLLARLRRVREQVGRADQHPRRAVPALEGVVLRERLLQRVELAVGC